MTDKQRRIFEFIRNFYITNSRMPTIQEIANNFGYSVSTVHQYISKLTELGFLKKINRGWYEIPSEYLYRQIPFYGEIAAGLPISIWEEPIDYLDPHIECEGCIALQIKGNSMIEDGILNGDIIIVEPKQDFINGETVVAIIDNNFATVKKFYKHKDLIELRPANYEMESQFYEPERVRIVGKIKHLIRNY